MPTGDLYYLHYISNYVAISELTECSVMTWTIVSIIFTAHTSLHSRSWEISWWRHQMETFSALLVLCVGNSPVTGEFPSQRPVTRSFDVFFDPRLNKRLIKQSWGWWFETASRPLWRHGNGSVFCADNVWWSVYLNCRATSNNFAYIYIYCYTYKIIQNNSIHMASIITVGEQWLVAIWISYFWWII